MADTTTNARICHGCKMPDSHVHLKQCTRCKSALYCSRDCQKSDWQAHKKTCGSNAQARVGSEPETPEPNTQDIRAFNILEVDFVKPFHRLYENKRLHDRTETDVFKLLIDTYRLRMDDDYKFTDVDTDSLYDGARDGCVGFALFLTKAEKTPGLLPEWWTPEKASKCLQYGLCPDNWSNISCAVDRNDIIDHYENSLMPMQMRMFSERVYGTGPGGLNSVRVLQFMMRSEAKEGGYLCDMNLRNSFR